MPSAHRCARRLLEGVKAAHVHMSKRTLELSLGWNVSTIVLRDSCAGLRELTHAKHMLLAYRVLFVVAPNCM